MQLAKTPEMRKMLLDGHGRKGMFGKGMFGMLSLTSSINSRDPKSSHHQSPIKSSDHESLHQDHQSLHQAAGAVDTQGTVVSSASSCA